MSKPTYEELEQRIRILEQTEIRLKKSEIAMQQYKRAVEISLDLMVELDRNYIYKFANKGYLKYHQLDEEQVIGHSFEEVAGKDHFRDNIKPYFDRCLDGETIQYETFYTYREKGKCYMEVWNYPRINQEGQVQGIVALARDISDRKLADEKLSESENKFRSITENAVDFIFIKDKGRRYTFVNQAMTNLLGLPKEEILGKSPEEIFDVKQASIVKEVDDLTFSGKTVNETRSLTINDKPFFFNTMQTPLSMKDGEVSSIMGIVRDVTDRKLAEAALRESEEKYRDLYDNASDMFVSVQAQTAIIIDSNQTLAKELGYTKEEIIGRPVFDLYTPDSAKYAKSNVFPLFMKNGIIQGEELQLQRKDGSKIDVNLNTSAVYDEEGNILYSRSVWRDITERKRVEEALKESLELSNKVISESPIGILLYDELGQCIEANESIGKIIGATKEEVLKQNYNELESWKKSGMLYTAKKVINEGRPKRFEGQTTSTFGVSFNIDSYFVPFLKEGKAHLMVMVIDITDRLQAEEDKIKALEFVAEQSRHALIGQVAGKMAHDFNNVLMGIMGNAQLATMDCDNEELKVMLENINEFALRGRDITNNLISYSKDQEPKQTYFRIEDKIELVLKMFEKDLSGIKVSRNYKPGISELLADPGMIQDSLVNIIQNSIHAMSKVENPTLILKAYSKNNKVYIEVEDNGCGIPKEHLDSIYTPSFTLKGSHDETGSYKSEIKGTGYGMSNVKKYIVEKHKGNISLESEVGQGTKIIVALRIIKDRLSSAEKKEIVKSQIHDQRKILLVEDEPAIADVQYQLLTKEPFKHIVSIAANGQTAIDTFDRNQFDLVSLDYMLPGNINGLDVYHHIRENDQDIPVLFISGNIEFIESMNQLKEKDLHLEYLSKPIDNLDYVNKINELAGSTA
ncbi:MAG: PAS domain S-box protein [Deltaproteobacteria bacterium]|nr:PAS domain S-box protein [Deltaproteobacteria bacterium]